jgi:hypothetical protein
MDTKETTELLEVMGTAAALIKKIAKDGVNAADLIHIKDLADLLEPMKEAIEGIKDVPAELKDLDEAEVLGLIGTIYNQAKKINEA